MSQGSLYVIIPTTRGEKAFPSIYSALSQRGFENVFVLICGKSANNQEFANQCLNKFNSRVIVLHCPAKEHILPGEARNIGIEYVVRYANPSDYILFLDDDICIPPNYAIDLKNFISCHGLAAAMGNMTSFPINIWSKIIDYSNFWWLQCNRDCLNRGWLGAGATILKISDISSIRYLSDIAINEDIDFFDRISTLTTKKLGICSSIRSRHFHNRSSLIGLIKYQFLNGYRGPIYHLTRKRVILQSLKRWVSFSKVAIKENINYLKYHIVELIGVIFSFLIVECGAVLSTLRRR